MANEKQFTYWNEVAGPKWVKIGDEMDSRFTAITDLLVTQADVKPGERVLDIGCGMGPTTFRFADKAGSDGHVTGIDISTPMLNVARERGVGIPRLDFLLADAQTFEFVPAKFDVLTSRFGVMFFADPVAAFTNLRTALVPGGRVCFVCWATLDENPHWNVPFQLVAKRLGYPDERPARAPGPMAFADAGYVTEILTKAGYSDIAVTPTPVPIIGKNLTEEAQIACLLGPSGALTDEKQADEATRQILRENISIALAQFDSPHGIKLPATVNVITATNR
ncbi:MAG: class I SAM-dependent methyltransferase [Acidocella sp.]|nr:class I SAM-dependent methyltransferase [Acidocella sp.]